MDSQQLVPGTNPHQLHIVSLRQINQHFILKVQCRHPQVLRNHIREGDNEAIHCRDNPVLTAVSSSDLAVASEEAKFITPGVNIGLFCSTSHIIITL